MADSVNGIKSASSVEPNSTIGDVLDRQAERFAERDALVNVESGERYTYAEFRDEVERVARGLMALGIQHGHHVGIWATNYSEVGADPVRHRQDWRGYGQRQPGLSNPRTGVCAGAVRSQRHHSHRPVPQFRLRGDAQRSCPGAEGLEPWRAAQLAVPVPEKRHLHPTPQRWRGTLKRPPECGPGMKWPRSIQRFRQSSWRCDSLNASPTTR